MLFMFIVITPSKIFTAKTLDGINKQIHSQIDMDEFKSIGGDLIVNMSSADLDFVQDKRKLSSIMFGNFFKKDNTARNLIIINLIFTFIILTRVMSLGG
jgi:hypothetical protein